MVRKALVAIKDEMELSLELGTSVIISVDGGDVEYYTYGGEDCTVFNEFNRCKCFNILRDEDEEFSPLYEHLTEGLVIIRAKYQKDSNEFVDILVHEEYIS